MHTRKSVVRRTRAAITPLHGLAIAALLVLAGVLAERTGLAPALLEDMSGPRNCATARALGIDNARRGETGYAAWLDADNDGVACEPWSGSAR